MFVRTLRWFLTGWIIGDCKKRAGKISQTADDITPLNVLDIGLQNCHLVGKLWVNCGRVKNESNEKKKGKNEWKNWMKKGKRIEIVTFVTKHDGPVRLDFW